jgi:multicomponent Na+:H+ antiporter subunit G
VTVNAVIAIPIVSVGCFFFLAGTVGLLRFPDLYTRLHALTKADNMGLGLVALGVMIHFASWAVAGKILLIWCLTLVASSSASQLIARSAHEAGLRCWEEQ